MPPDLQGYTTLNQCHAVPITGSCAPNVPRGERRGRGDTASPEPLAGRPRRHRRRPAAGRGCRLQRVAGRALRVPAGWACGPPFPRPAAAGWKPVVGAARSLWTGVTGTTSRPCRRGRDRSRDRGVDREVCVIPTRSSRHPVLCDACYSRGSAGLHDEPESRSHLRGAGGPTPHSRRGWPYVVGWSARRRRCQIQ